MKENITGWDNDADKDLKAQTYLNYYHIGDENQSVFSDIDEYGHA